jgi:hypothetical protein
MQISQNRPNTLLEQIVYVSCQLPARIIINAACRLSKKLQEYTSVKPLLIIIDYILCYVAQRLDALGTHMDQLSGQTQDFVRGMLVFHEKLARLLMSSIISGSQHYTQDLKNQPWLGKITATLLAPWLIAKYAYQTGNADAFGNAILTQADASQCAHAIRSYTRFLMTLATTTLLVPLPIIQTQKITAFIPRSQRIGHINFPARIASSALVFSFLYIILAYKAYLIDKQISAATHFILVTMSTVMLTSIIIAPCDRAIRFVCRNMVVAFLLCWFCSPAIFALS